MAVMLRARARRKWCDMCSRPERMKSGTRRNVASLSPHDKVV